MKNFTNILAVFPISLLLSFGSAYGMESASKETQFPTGPQTVEQWRQERRSKNSDATNATLDRQLADYIGANGSEQLLSNLLAQGADPNYVSSANPNPTYRCALVCACYHQKAPSVRLLLDWKADPNIQSDPCFFNTALHNAAWRQNPVIIRYLFMAGAKEMQDRSGQLPSFIASNMARKAEMNPLFWRSVIENTQTKKEYAEQEARFKADAHAAVLAHVPVQPLCDIITGYCSAEPSQFLHKVPSIPQENIELLLKQIPSDDSKKDETSSK